MNNEHEVYIQIEDAGGPRPIKIRDDDTIGAVLAHLRAEHPLAVHEPELLAVFAEDADDESPKDQKFCEFHPTRPKILLCHRCREIKIVVFYNGQETHGFRPNARIRRVTEWAKDKFKVDADHKWVLRTGTAEGEILDPDTHVGKLVKFPDCHLTLFLTERCLIQG